MRQPFAGVWIAVQLGIISLWLMGCQPATASPKLTVTFTPTMQPSDTSSATPTLQPAPTLTATATFEGDGRFMGSFGAGVFSGVFRSPDGKHIFAIFNARELRWYNAKTLEQEGAVDLGRHAFAPYDMLFASNPNIVVVIDDYIAPVIDLEHRKIIAAVDVGLQTIGSVQFSPDQKQLFFSKLTFHGDLVGVLDIQQDQRQGFYWNGDCDHITDPKISLDGKWIAVGCDKLVQIRDLQTSEMLLSMEGHTSNIASVAFNTDGTRLLSVDADGTIFLWDRQTGRSVHTINLNSELLEKDEIEKISFAEDDQHALLEFRYAPAKLVDLKTDQITDAPVKPTPTLDPFVLELHRRGYSQSLWGAATLAISPDRKTLAVGSRTVLLWDIAGQKLINTLESTTHSDLMEIKFDQTKPKLAGVTREGQILLWDITSTSQPNLATVIGDADQDGRQGLSFSPDGKLLAVGHGTDVEIWDVETAQLVKTLQAGGYGNINYVFGTEFLADGHSLYVILDLPELHRYSGRPDRKGIQLWNIEKGQLINQRNLPDSNGYLIAFHWPLLALHNESDVTYAADWLEIWNVQTGKMQKLPSSFEIAPVAFSDDLKLLFARDYSIDALYIWQVESGKLAYISKGYSKYYNPALLGSSNFLASSERGFVRLFDISAIIEHARQPDITPVPLPTP